MALINYPQVNPNFWGRGVQDRSSQIFMQAKMINHRNQVQAFGMLRSIMSELDPVALMSDQFKVLQAEKIQGIENFATDLMKGKGRRKNLTQQDLMGIQWEVEKYNAWEAGAKASQDQFKQAYDTYNKAEDGHYKLDHFLAGMDEFMETGKHPVGGYLKIAPGDWLGAAGHIKLFDEEGLETVYEDRVFDRKRNEWVKNKTTTTRFGILDPNDPEGRTIDETATQKQKSSAVWTLFNSNLQNLAWADEEFERMRLLAKLPGADPKLVEDVQRFEKMAADYKTNAEVQEAMNKMQGKERDFPQEIKASHFMAHERGMQQVQPDRRAFKSEVEGDTLTKARLDAANDKEEDAPDGSVELIGAGAEWGFSGSVSTYSGKNNKNIDAPLTVTYKPDRTERVTKIPKGAKFLTDSKTYFIGAPQSISEYEVYGKFASENEDLLNRNWPVEEVEINYNVPVYVGEDIDVSHEDVKLEFKSGQPVSKEEMEALQQYAKDNDLSLDDLVQGSNKDFARIVLKLGTLNGAPGSAVVMRELSDGYVMNMPFMSGVDYTPAPKEESERVVEEAEEQAEERASSPWIPKWLKRKKKQQVEPEPVVEDDWEQYKR